MVGSTREGVRTATRKTEAVKTMKVVGKNSSLFFHVRFFGLYTSLNSPQRASPSVTNRLVRWQCTKSGQAKGRIFCSKGIKM